MRGIKSRLQYLQRTPYLACVEVGDSKDTLNEITDDENQKVDVIIDFSNEKSIYEYGEYAKRTDTAIVTAISKYETEEKKYIKELSNSIRVLWSPNITLGINFLIIAAKVLKQIAPTCDIEILEEHFNVKS